MPEDLLTATAPSKLKIKVYVKQIAGGVIAVPTWQLDRELPPSESVDAHTLLAFRDAVGNTVAKGARLPTDVQKTGSAIYGALLHGAVAEFLKEAQMKNAYTRLELHIEPPQLRGVPWEALGAFGDQSLAEQLDLALVRIPSGNESVVKPPREVKGRLRVLVIAPNEQKLQELLDALAELRTEGWLELCEPIVGDKAGARYLEQALLKGRQEKEEINVVHYIGHGGTNTLFDENADAVPADWLANLLQRYATKNAQALRLVFLQACEGAAVGESWSTAEVIANRCGVAVVGHLFPVESLRSTRHAAAFYDNLLRDGNSPGDVALALQSSRRALSADGADAFSPVLYHAATADSVVFTLKNVPSPKPADVSNPQDLHDVVALLRNPTAPCSLLLGDLEEVIDADKAGFRIQLEDALVGLEVATRDELRPLTMSILAQRYALYHPPGTLNELFQNVFDQMLDALDDKHDFVDAIAQHLRPGVHVSLTWMPSLERALARHHEDHDIYVVTPKLQGSQTTWSLWKKPAGEKQFAHQKDWPESGKILETAYMVLHIRGGYAPTERIRFQDPLVTEDAHIDTLASLAELPSADLREAISTHIYERPVLCVAMTALSWRHRLVLRRLLGGGTVSKAALVLSRSDRYAEESRIWGHGELSIGKRVFVVKQVALEELATQLDAAALPGEKP